MPKSSPDISVLLPVYNAQNYLEKAIDSILAQSFKNFELVLINDGSTDDSTEICRKFAREDSRIVLIEQENKGLITTLNLGIETCRAPLIARMDADDIAEKERFARQKLYMDENPDTLVLGSAITLIDEYDQLIGKVRYPKAGRGMDHYIFKHGSPVAHPAVMMSRKAALELGGYRIAYKHAEDYDLWLRFHKMGKIHNLEESLLRYRHHSGQITVQNAKEQALVSVIARYAAKEKEDPTQNLAQINEATLDLFDNKKETIRIEYKDILATSLLLSHDHDMLLNIQREMPGEIPKDARYAAARLYLKFAIVYFKHKDYSRALCHVWKSIQLEPSALIQTLKRRI